VSIVAAMLGAEVVATDGEDTVVDQLAANAERHLPHTLHKIRSRVLLWGQHGNDPAGESLSKVCCMVTSHENLGPS